MELRPYQNECLDAILNKYIEGIRRMLVVKATGVGKAVVIANIQKKVGHLLPGKILLFAHTEELVDQLVATYKEWNPTKKVGKEQADVYADTDCDVVVSCVASIGRNGSTRLSRFGRFDIVICDEAHHSIAQTYLNVFNATGIFEPGTKCLLVGFTATPKRKNRKVKTETNEDEILSLKSVYQEIVFVYPIRKAIKNGWLVPLRGYRIKTDVNLDKVKVTAGDFQQDQLAEAVNERKRNLEILEAWKKYGENRQTVVFAVDIKHAQDLSELFRSDGIRAEAVWGTDPRRAEKLTQHKNKEITVLFNAKVLTEGYDDWRVSCIVPAAPTRNGSLYTQEIGRGTRLQGGTGNLLEALAMGVILDKKDCIILDVVDNSKRCSLVTLPSLVGLDPEMDLHGSSITAAAERIEELQNKYPMIDLSGIKDLDKVDAYMESIDLFAEPYTEEVKEFSKLTWIGATDGSYILSIPESQSIRGEYWAYKYEKLHIRQNELDEFELSLTSAKDPERKLGTYNTIKEAFVEADDVIQRCRPDRMKVLTREGFWRDQTASEAVRKYLKRLVGKKPFTRCLCPGYQTIGTPCKTCKLLPLSAGDASTAVEILKVKK
jgi:superfamily II DNA or RNA helicase